MKEGKAAIPGKCPTGKKCFNTVTLCKKCLSAEIPGNIAYGLIGSYVLGFDWAKQYSDDLNRKENEGSPDSKEDVESITIGHALLQHDFYSRKRFRFRWQGMQHELCRLVQLAIANNKFDVKTECDLCPHELRRRWPTGIPRPNTDPLF